MWCCWMLFILACVSMATPMLCQSGDGEWGSGIGIFSAITATNDTSQAISDEPVRMRNNHDWITPAAFSPSPSPSTYYEPQPDKCSVYFSTNAALARRLKAQKEELAYLQAIQHGNKAVMENLVQFVGAELGDQSYEDVIKENVIGIQEDHKSCHDVVEKAEEDLEKQLEGGVKDTSSGMQKIREESLAFEEMLRAAADIANRLESSSLALHASFTKQLKDIAKIQH
ncbi:uncharacterized protein LOC113137375 [Mastacembelus armatus]|uniref:uncharacterized protein LOC113137375 n=1 Tax=Mastacembelus armatus TaxID=205130 RepID=UPI000E457E18|nr:uncharacterized protein LOC113137375 [Mastacembelus armatus]XP_026174766.1 uncharacterized protein LOC113137375 [Mastacembelus armatus]